MDKIKVTSTNHLLQLIKKGNHLFDLRIPAMKPKNNLKFIKISGNTLRIIHQNAKESQELPIAFIDDTYHSQLGIAIAHQKLICIKQK